MSSCINTKPEMSTPLLLLNLWTSPAMGPVRSARGGALGVRWDEGRGKVRH